MIPYKNARIPLYVNPDISLIILLCLIIDNFLLSFGQISLQNFFRLLAKFDFFSFSASFPIPREYDIMNKIYYYILPSINISYATFAITFVPAISIPPPITPPTNGIIFTKFTAPFSPNLVTNLNPTF